MIFKSQQNSGNFQGGSIANKTGKDFEAHIELSIGQNGYTYIDKRYFFAACILDQPIYTKQLYIGKTIYQTNRTCDFILHHPSRYPRCLVIEAKWQQASGSVDEKFPFLVFNIEQLDYPTIIIVDGRGAKPGAIDWLKSRRSNKLVAVFNLIEFSIFAAKQL